MHHRALGFVIVLGACGSSAYEPPVGKLDRIRTVDDDVLHLRVAGRAVPLRSVPELVEQIPLPMTGAGDIDLDLRVPMIGGEPDYTRATGSAALRCEACGFGEAVTFAKLDLQITFAGGEADITRWVVQSPDVRVELAFHLTLDRAFPHSRVRGCLRYQASPELAQRDPNTASALMLVGAPLAPDGFFTVELGGRLDEMKKLAVVCGPVTSSSSP